MTTKKTTTKTAATPKPVPRRGLPASGAPDAPAVDLAPVQALLEEIRTQQVSLSARLEELTSALRASNEEAAARHAAVVAAIEENGVNIRENSANVREGAADARETRRRIEKLDGLEQRVTELESRRR